MEFNKMLLSLVLVNGVSGVCLAIDVNNVNDMVARFGGVGSDTKSLDQNQALELANKFVEKGNTDTFWVSSILRAQFSSDTTLNKIGEKNSTVFAPAQFDAMKDLLGSADRSVRQAAFDRMKSASPAVEAPAPAPAPSIGGGSGSAVDAAAKSRVEPWVREYLRSNTMPSSTDLIYDINNSRRGDGVVVLMAAANQGRLQEVKDLLALGADKSLVDNSGRTALAFAKNRSNSANSANYDEIIRLLS